MAVSVVEHAQRRVQVVEARVDEPQADHGQPEQAGQLGVRPPGRCGSRSPASKTSAGEQEVALALVDVLGHRVSPGSRGRRTSPGTRGPPRPAAGSGTGRRAPSRRRRCAPLAANTMSGSPATGSISLHVVAERRGRPARSRVHCRMARAAVGRLVRCHPRVDRVRDGEVVRRAHQVPARTGPALPCDHEARLGVRRAGKHAPAMRVSSESLRKCGPKRRFVA